MFDDLGDEGLCDGSGRLCMGDSDRLFVGDSDRLFVGDSDSICDATGWRVDRSDRLFQVDNDSFCPVIAVSALFAWTAVVLACTADGG